MNTDPPGLGKSRAEYVKALRAKNGMQMIHQRLQMSLDELQNQHNLEAPAENDSHYENEVTRSYISLLRQRRRYSEFRVVQDSLEKLINAGPFIGLKDAKALVKEAIGDQPDLPVEPLDKLTQAQADDALLLRLKKEVLEAKSGMDRAISARRRAPGASRTHTPEEQVYALTRAQVMIVDWIQGELAKMEEESEFMEDSSPVKQSVEGVCSPNFASSESSIRKSYERYVVARLGAIKSQESIEVSRRQPDPPHSTDHPRLSAVTTQDRVQLAPASNVAKILPLLSCLSIGDKQERSLLQQAVYLQSQISSADEELAESLSRLSGESHLLPSGSKGIVAWSQTATEVAGLNENFIRGQLKDSRQEVGSVATILDLYSLQSRVLSSG